MDWICLTLLLLVLRIGNANCICDVHADVDWPITITSPNYPKPYPHNARCTWILTQLTPGDIFFRFEDFQTEYTYDFLEMTGGLFSRQEHLIGKYSGVRIPTITRTSDRRIRMTFKTDSSTALRGFKVTLSKGFYQDEKVCRSAYYQCYREKKCISLEKVCDGQVDCFHRDDERSCPVQSTAVPLQTPTYFEPVYESCNIGNVTIPNGVYSNCHQDVNVAHNSVVTVTCKTGYTTADKTNREIQCVNGDWTNIPECILSCSAPNLPSTVSLVALYNRTVYFKGETVLVNCSIGYFLTESAISPFVTLTCNGNNIWSPQKLICSPKEQFHYIYKPQQEMVHETSFGDALHLPCDFKDRFDSGVMQWLWLKDAVDIASKPNFSYTIDSENGSLFIPAVTLENVGSYTCLVKSESQYIPTSVMHIVKTLADCLPGPTNRTMIVKEYSSAIMFCPDTGSQFQEPPIWYANNGKRIVNDEKFNLVLNAGLLIRSVAYSEEGQYTCDVGPNTPFCSGKFITHLQVLPTTESVCGSNIKLGHFPWLVTLWLFDETAPFCYGALVNEQWVVTTAVCLFGLHQKRDPGVFVHLGQHNSNENSTIIPVAFARIHPQFSRRNNMADIGVVKLKQPTAYNADIVPICLTDIDLEVLLNVNLTACDIKPSLRGQVSGFGSLETELDKGDMETMEVYSQSECCMAESGTCQKIQDGIFCAKGLNLVPKYVGDIGAPLQVLFKRKMYLYGLFSFGERRSQISEYDYFTNVTTHYKWVADKIRG